MTEHHSTRAVHAGEEKHKPYHTLTTSIARTSTYTFRNSAEITAFMEEKATGNAPFSRTEYGRYGNPTQSAAERKLADLEGGERALLFVTGMAAVSTTLLTLLSSGDHIILGRDSFYQTREFAQTLLSRWGIETTLVENDRPEAFAAAIRPKTRLIFVESPSNPYLRVADLPKIVEIARANKLLTVVSPLGTSDGGVQIHQNAWFSLGNLDQGFETTYNLHDPANGVYAFVIEGQVKIGDQVLDRRDGMGIKDAGSLQISASQNSTLLLMEVPV